MSETQQTLFNLRRRPHIALCSRHLCVSGIWIAGALVLLLTVVSFRAPSTSSAVNERTDPEPDRVRLASPKVFDVEAFKRTIIDNNLFRPLGWRPPVPREPYRLIGTKLATDANTPPQAIIESIAGEKTYIVSTGETLDTSTEVVSIESKQVTLSSNGEQRTLRLNTTVTLNASAATRSPRRTTHTPPTAPVNRQPTPAPTAVSAPQPPDRRPPLSDWETREGQPIPIGDARLKNPAKWELRRR